MGVRGKDELLEDILNGTKNLDCLQDCQPKKKFSTPDPNDTRLCALFKFEYLRQKMTSNPRSKAYFHVKQHLYNYLMLCSGA
ncbi:hypothetical protein PROFUN_13729 [Planoprotostelium fungivorum]|uniref:Uncharacterized protein n=1 Tax=Planoprotostelium fungivorum TaxID=1890364 RepID=A0A2P6MWX0_9EUKA|nr:hypothetical protein PROFUN_13729 [Planoprotostelium fungivorum]